MNKMKVAMVGLGAFASMATFGASTVFAGTNGLPAATHTISGKADIVMVAHYSSSPVMK